MSLEAHFCDIITLVHILENYLCRERARKKKEEEERRMEREREKVHIFYG